MVKDKSVAFFERGSWYHRTKVLQDDYTVSYGKKGGFSTKEEAEESYKIYEEEFLKQSAIHNVRAEQDVFLSDYLIFWFESIFKKKPIENTYMLGIAYMVYDLIVPYLKQNDSSIDIKLKLINVTYFDSILVELSKQTKSAGNKCRECLNLAMSDALANRYINYNPMPETKQYKRNKPKVKVIKKEELKQLLHYAQFDNWYLEILLGAFCGLRKGEIIGLKFDDFDEEKQIIRIRRQLVYDPKLSKETDINEVKVEEYQLTEKSPKKNSFRNIRVPKVICEEIQKRKKELEAFRMTNKDFDSQNYISFNRETGNVLFPSSLNTYLVRSCPKIGIPTISVHSLRHIFTTILMERNVPLVKISALLGHSSPNTTFEIYCDIMDEREKILAFINNTFSQERLVGVV